MYNLMLPSKTGTPQVALQEKGKFVNNIYILIKKLKNNSIIFLPRFLCIISLESFILFR